MVNERKTERQFLLNLTIWILFFMLLAPAAGFDVDILYTFTFFGLIFFIIQKLSKQINEVFVSEQFRLIQLILQKRIGVYWLLQTARVWSSDRIVLFDTTIKELANYFRILSVQATNVDQLIKNVINFTNYHRLMVGHLSNLKQIWTRIVFGNVIGAHRLYRPVFLQSQSAATVHFLTSVNTQF